MPLLLVQQTQNSSLDFQLKNYTIVVFVEGWHVQCKNNFVNTPNNTFPVTVMKENICPNLWF